MTAQKPKLSRRAQIGEWILSIFALLVPLMLRMVEKPAMPAFGSGNSTAYDLTVILASVVMLKLALTRLTRRLRGGDGGRILGVVILSVASLLPVLYFLSWAIGLCAWLMFIPYSLLAASFLKLPAARDPFA